MKTTIFKGLSGLVQFDQQGNRENFQLDVVELVSDGLKKVAIWNSSTNVGLRIFREEVETFTGETGIFNGRTLKILTVDEVRIYLILFFFLCNNANNKHLFQ